MVSLTIVKSRQSVQDDLTLSVEQLAAWVEEFKAMADLLESLDALSQVAVDSSEREKALFALDSVITFIMRVCKREGLPTPLIKLRNALTDLENGVVVPMLRVEERNSFDPIGRTLLKSAAAATMSLLMKTGCCREQAARQVAAQLRRGRMTFGDRRSREPWRTVADWRDQAVKATKSKSEDSLLGWGYEEYLKQVIIPPPTDMREHERFRKGILETLLRATRYDDA